MIGTCLQVFLLFILLEGHPVTRMDFNANG
jgi:hypothetical protein